MRNFLEAHLWAPQNLIWPAIYFATIVLSNMLMIWLTPIALLGTVIPPAIILFSFVFVLRDFAQRAIGHAVLLFMAAAAIATYLTAGPAVAVASVTAFIISEMADWATYSLTRRPMAQRIVLSSLISVPVDTAVFFFALGILDAHSLLVGTMVKMLGTAVVWSVLAVRKEVWA